MAVLEDWIKMGAPWPASKVAVREEGKDITDEMRAWWSFQPLKAPAIPAVKDAAWAKTDIDRLVLAKLEAKGLKPAAPADRRTLIRRATLDLIGLPPTEEEVHAFEQDKDRRPTRRCSIACSTRRATASVGAVTGWTSRATPMMISAA